MRKTLLIFTLLTAACGFAQTEQPDSVKAQELDEVVVESRTQRVIDRGVEYTPGKKVKKIATDATQLLQLMNIPQLNITPGSMSVKTYAGKDVAMYIDYRQATSEDLQGLRPEDVLRVEVLQYPEDPRFRGNANVVNFIMRKYEWGGYTKLTLKGTTLECDRGNGILYSKFTRKRWTFDASVSGGLSHNNNADSYNVETFRDVYVGDRHYDAITRTSWSDKHNLTLNNNQYAIFRAIYGTDSTQIYHSISFGRNATPIERSLSSVTYSDDVFSASSALSKESGQTLSPSMTGYYYFALPKGNTLLASWSFVYGSTRRYSSYLLGDQAPIINNNKEESYAPTAAIQYSKRFSHNNTFRTSLMTYNTLYHTDYRGSYNGLQKLLSSENMLFLEYMQNWKFGLSMYSRVGMSYVIGRVNGTNTLEQWNPRLGLQLQYQINDRHSATLEGWWGNNHPTPASSNSALVQSNELLWLQGNPDLRNTTYISSSASYTFIPSNLLSLSATAEYEGLLKRTIEDYFSLPGHDGLVRKEINSGNFHSVTGYVSATLKLFQNSLSFRATGQISRMTTSGIVSQSMNILSANLQANYYFKNLSFVLYYNSPGKYISSFGNGAFRYKSNYGFIANFAAGDFKVGLQFSNWFNRNQYYLYVNTDRYSSHTHEWVAHLARTLQLTLSYTIPYGKKVQRDNELGSGGTAGSAILK